MISKMKAESIARNYRKITELMHLTMKRKCIELLYLELLPRAISNIIEVFKKKLFSQETF